VNPSGRRSFPDRRQTRVGQANGIDRRILGAVHRQWVVDLGTDAEVPGSITCRVRPHSSDTKLHSDPAASGSAIQRTEGLAWALPSQWD
jgi:hypothetical protein